MLSAVDQEKQILIMPFLDRNHPLPYWIFRNADYVQWNDSCSQVLWLAGPSEYNIHEVSSYIVNQEKKSALKTGHFVLYFFCSTATKRESIMKDFVHTLLDQIVCCSPTDWSLSIIHNFLHSLLRKAFQKHATPPWEMRGFNERDSRDGNIRKLLDAPAKELLITLGTVLKTEQRGLSVVIDGLENVWDQRAEFVMGIRSFVGELQQRTSKVKILLTSRPMAEIKAVFGGLPCIEHDRERRGSSASYFLIRGYAEINE
jgi:hypothetical protein